MITTHPEAVISIARARDLADGILARLEPVCVRLELAGSLRRWRPEVATFDFVAIPRQRAAQDLFGGKEMDPAFEEVMATWPKLNGANGRRYENRAGPCGLPLNVFLAREENFGLVLVQRTGSEAFLKQYVAPAWIRAGFRIHGEMLHRGGQPWSCPSEKALFHAIGLAMVNPELRL